MPHRPWVPEGFNNMLSTESHLIKLFPFDADLVFFASEMGCVPIRRTQKKNFCFDTLSNFLMVFHFSSFLCVLPLALFCSIYLLLTHSCTFFHTSSPLLVWLPHSIRQRCDGCYKSFVWGHFSLCFSLCILYWFVSLSLPLLGKLYFVCMLCSN